MKRIMLALTAALILAAMTVVAVPAMAQQTKEETKTEEKSKEKDKGKEEEKDKMKEDEKKDLPQSGGVSIDAALLGLTAGTLLVGGGLVARRAIRQR